jgi:prevent-host-death family protein
MYVSYMPELADRSVSDARRDLAAVIDEARVTHEPVYLSRRGRRVAAVVSSDDFERLRGLAEDMTDILDAEAARREMREAGNEPIPWDQAKVDLGLA